MKRLLLAAVVFTATVATVAVAADLKVSDLAGDYKVFAMKKGGKEVKLEGVNSVTIAGDKITVNADGIKRVATIKVDGSKKPYTLDLTNDDGPQKGQASLGIFQVGEENKVLTIAVRQKGARPTDFKGAGDGEMVLTLVRAQK